MNTRLLPLCAALIVALPLAASAQTTPVPTSPPVALRYKWTPGEVRSYKITMDMNIAMTMSGLGPKAPGLMPPMIGHTVMTYDLTVQSVNPADGSVTLTEHITQINATLNGKSVPGMGAGLDASKGDVTLVMSPLGKVLSMHLPAATAGKLPPGMDFSKIGEATSATLPSFPAHIGDTWQDSTTMHLPAQIPGMAALQTTVFSTLAGISKDAHPIASISQTSQGTLNGAIPAGAAGKLDMTGQFQDNTLLKFDVDNGSVTGQDGTMTMNTNATLPNMPNSSAPKTMRMRMQMTTHLERLPGAS